MIDSVFKEGNLNMFNLLIYLYFIDKLAKKLENRDLCTLKSIS